MRSMEKASEEMKKVLRRRARRTERSGGEGEPQISIWQRAAGHTATCECGRSRDDHDATLEDVLVLSLEKVRLGLGVRRSQSTHFRGVPSMIACI